MGSGGSREAVVIPVDTKHASSQSGIDEKFSFEQSQRAAAEAQYRQAEERLFREGYERGRQDTLNSLNEEIAKAATVAYATEALKAESALQDKVKEMVPRLQKQLIRPPVRELACQAEEASLLACDEKVDKLRCAKQIEAYVSCADRSIIQQIDSRTVLK